MKSLVPCPSCRRHVRASESACPFCQADLPDSLAGAVIPGAAQRMSRAAAFAFTATLTLTGCGAHAGPSGPGPSSDAPATTDGPADDGAVMALYGASVDVPVGSDAASDAGAPADDGTPQAMYGGPPRPDAGPRDDGSVMALYGAVPSDLGMTDNDAGPQDEGAVMALYGVPVDRDSGGGGVRYGAPPPDDMV